MVGMSVGSFGEGSSTVIFGLAALTSAAGAVLP